MALPPLDIPLVMEQLRPGQDCGNGCVPGATYAQLVAGWRGPLPIPTEAEVINKWNELVAGRRVPKILAGLIAEIIAMPALDRTRLFALVAAAWLREHPAAARAVGVSLDGDEPLPPG